MPQVAVIPVSLRTSSIILDASSLCRHVISAKIVCHIHKNLIYRINTDILRCDILKINIVYACTVIHIQSHTRRCNNVCQLVLQDVRQAASHYMMHNQSLPLCFLLYHFLLYQFLLHIFFFHPDGPEPGSFLLFTC